jgi:hypothetical protein
MADGYGSWLMADGYGQWVMARSDMNRATVRPATSKIVCYLATAISHCH